MIAKCEISSYWILLVIYKSPQHKHKLDNAILFHLHLVQKLMYYHLYLSMPATQCYWMLDISRLYCNVSIVGCSHFSLPVF